VVEAALKAGADEAEAMSVRVRDVNVELQKNDLQIARSMSGDGMGLRVFKGGSLGFSYVNSFDDDSIRESVERAVGIAAAAPSDEYNVLPEPIPIEPLEDILDEAADEFGVETAVERTLAMLRTARDFDPRVTVDSGELYGHSGEKEISSSRRVRADERSSLYYCYIFGMAKEGESVSSFDFQFDGARRAAAIDPESVALRFAENVVSSLGAVKGESFRVGERKLCSARDKQVPREAGADRRVRHLECHRRFQVEGWGGDNGVRQGGAQTRGASPD